MGLKHLAVAAAASLAAVAPADYIASRQLPGGAFAEPGGAPDPALTAWAVLGLQAVGREPPRNAAAYLHAAPVGDTTDLALRLLALRSLGDVRGLDAELRRRRRADGRFGAHINSTAWGALAAGKPHRTTIRFLIRAQHRSGGWSWAPGGAPDSNDTAAVIQALRAGGVGGRPIRRGLAYIERLTAPSGGVRLVPGRDPDAQSTAWAVQAYVAAGVRPPRAAYQFLRSLRRSDGSYRYSRRYAVTPTLVTAHVLPALAGKAHPLR